MYMNLGSSETGQLRSQQRFPLYLTSYRAVHQGVVMICCMVVVHKRHYANVLSWGGCGIGRYMYIRQYERIDTSVISNLFRCS